MLRELDDISVQLRGDDRRPIDTAGRARTFAPLTIDAVETVRSMRVDDASGEEVEDVEIRFRGHAAVFESRTWIGGKRWGFWEEIGRSAFDECLARPDDVRFLVNHNPDKLLARNTAGTMELSIDERGLLVESRIAPHSVGRDIAISLERRDITQMSFAFDMGEYEYSTDADDVSIYRHTNFAQLYDVAVVTYPAYDDTDASLRTMSRMMRPDPAPGDGASNPSGDITTVEARSKLRRRTLAARTAQAAGTLTPQQKG